MPRTKIDWGLTTWEGARREQLRRWSELPLDRIILALEEMQHLSEMLNKPARQQGLYDEGDEIVRTR